MSIDHVYKQNFVEAIIHFIIQAYYKKKLYKDIQPIADKHANKLSRIDIAKDDFAILEEIETYLRRELIEWELKDRSIAHLEDETFVPTFEEWCNNEIYKILPVIRAYRRFKTKH